MRVANARRALALAAARFYPRQPRDDRRRDRHQRQDFGRGLHAPDLGSARPARRRASAPSASSRRTREVYGSLTTPDPVELARTLDRARRGRRHASRDGGVLARPRPASPRWRAHRRRRLHQSQPRPPRLSSDRWKPISRRSCGCSSASCAPGGAAVDRADNEHADASIAAAAAARACGADGRARRGAASALVESAIDGFCADACASRTRASAYRVRLPLVGAFPGRECAWSRPAWRSRPGSDPRAVFAALGRTAKAPRVASNWSAQRNGAPIFVDYAHKPDALAKALDALRPYARRKLVVVFGAAATAMPASAR